MRTILISVFALMLVSSAPAQPHRGEDLPTHADSLRGGWTPLRSCYDVTFYDLDVRIDPSVKTIGGSNRISFRVLTGCSRLQIDLFRNLDITRMVLDGKTACAYERDGNAVFVSFGTPLRPGESHVLAVDYAGAPVVARMPPWDGGFIWKHDAAGNPWVAVACQGTGASLWWPNKDHPADEPDSMMIRVTVPPGLEDVSNGRLRGTTRLADGWTRYDWFVSYPINNYCVTVNVGKFAHFSDLYAGAVPLTLDFYVLPEHLEKAKHQFPQAKTMLASFEKFFGPYPFPRDGYKLVESPHSGMEHQSCVAYGNGFANGYGMRSSSAEGLTFDFIIIHESAHEWWGNSLTARDNADMWIHESFGAYAEALYVEDQSGREASLRYINAKKQNVRNEEPMQGVYGLNKEGSGDMYDKGQLVLNTLRSVLNNDTLWFSILRGLQERYRYETIDYDSVVSCISLRAGRDLAPFFAQYFRHAELPRLTVLLTKKGEEVTARYRWENAVPGFAMPVEVSTGEKTFGVITPTAQWQVLRLQNGFDPWSFRVADDKYYIDVRVVRSYLDPSAPDMPHAKMD